VNQSSIAEVVLMLRPEIFEFDDDAYGFEFPDQLWSERDYGGAEYEKSSPVACTAAPHVLACFEPYKTRLRDFHHDQLDRLAIKIVESFIDGRPIIQIRIVGHAAQWGSDSKLALSSARAKVVEKELKDRLVASGINIRRIRFTTIAASDRLPRTSNDTQANRALNRRVVIEIFKGPKPPPPPKKKCEPELELAKDLEEMPIAGLDQERQVRERIGCLRNMLVAALKECTPLDDLYLYPAPPYKKHLLQELKKRCAGKKGIKLARCFKTLYNEVLDLINRDGRELTILMKVLEVTPRDIHKTEECERGRFYLRKAKSEKSIYWCFRSIILPTFSYCIPPNI
jgi:hypothetical protein